MEEVTNNFELNLETYKKLKVRFTDEELDLLGEYRRATGTSLQLHELVHEITMTGLSLLMNKESH